MKSSLNFRQSDIGLNVINSNVGSPRTMYRLITSTWQFFREEDGTAAVEYAVLLGFIMMVMIGGIKVFANGTSGAWVNLQDTLETEVAVP